MIYPLLASKHERRLSYSLTSLVACLSVGKLHQRPWVALSESDLFNYWPQMKTLTIYSSYSDVTSTTARLSWRPFVWLALPTCCCFCWPSKKGGRRRRQAPRFSWSMDPKYFRVFFNFGRRCVQPSSIVVTVNCRRSIDLPSSNFLIQSTSHSILLFYYHHEIRLQCHCHCGLGRSSGECLYAFLVSPSASWRCCCYFLLLFVILYELIDWLNDPNERGRFPQRCAEVNEWNAR